MVILVDEFVIDKPCQCVFLHFFGNKAILHFNNIKLASDCHDHINHNRTRLGGGGDKLELDLLPNGQGILKAARPAGSIKGFVGLLAGSTNKVLSIEEMNEIVAAGWAGEK